MEAIIEFISEDEDAKFEQIQDLFKWLNTEKIDGVTIQKIESRTDNSMGVLDISLLILITMQPILIEVLKALRVWILSRKPKASLKFKDKDTGTTLVINLGNLNDIDKLIAKYSLK